MNKLDYNLEIIGEKKTFTPRLEMLDPILKSDKKIFEISGNNGCGKTFILNLIAFALDADKLGEDRILKTIKERIEDYNNTDYVNLEYSLELELPDSKKLVLTKDKNSAKRIQIDGCAPIGHKELHSELSVIYDVPRDPSERLKGVVKDLKKWNDNLYSKFDKINSFLFKLTGDFDNVRNQSKIDRLKSESEFLQNKIQGKTSQIESLSSQIDQLKNLDNLKKMLKYSRANDEYEKNLVRNQKIFKTLTKPKKIEKKDELKIQTLTSELELLNSDFENIIKELIRFINGDSEVLDEINESQSVSNNYQDIQNFKLNEICDDVDPTEKIISFQKSIEEVKNFVFTFIEEKKSGPSYKVHNTYSDLIELLDSLIENEIDHHLSKVISIDSSNLKEQLKSLIDQHKIKDYDVFESFFKTRLKPLNGIISHYDKTHVKLIKENKKKHVKNTDSKYYDIEAKVRVLKDNIKKTDNLFRTIQGSCAVNMGVDISHFDSRDSILKYIDFIKTEFSSGSLPDSLHELIRANEKSISLLVTNRTQLLSEKLLKDKRLAKEDSKHPSKYNSEQKNKIIRFQQLIEMTIKEILLYQNLINEFQLGNLHSTNHENDKLFIEIAGKIIASSMDNKLLRSGGEFINLHSYDMINEEFHCDDGIVIKKADVSTGLASANYLKQRIENVEGKYVVVLLDEIGNMDDKILGTVISSIKKLESQNRLVLAAFTKPRTNGIKIIEY